MIDYNIFSFLKRKRESFFDDLIGAKRRKIEEKSFFSDLPEELHTHILTKLPEYMICLKVPLVCKQWKNISDSFLSFYFAKFPTYRNELLATVKQLKREQDVAKQALVRLKNMMWVNTTPRVALFAVSFCPIVVPAGISLGLLGGMLGGVVGGAAAASYDIKKITVGIYLGGLVGAYFPLRAIAIVCECGLEAIYDVKNYSQKKQDCIEKIRYYHVHCG